MAEDHDQCTLCSRTKREHVVAEQNNDVHHRFAGPGGSLEHLKGEIPKKNAPPAAQVVSGPPFDPVLRTILLDKGIITLDDLEKAERTLRSTGVIRNHGDSSSGH